MLFGEGESLQLIDRYGGHAGTRTPDLLRVKQHVCSKLLMVLIALAALEAFRRTAGL